ncbi:MAG: beta-phosphoglucomutase [Bacteroidota bacterium]
MAIKYQGCIFDLDGVIVDTARYHFQAWKRTANRLGIPFSEQDNEHLKGVSRAKSLDWILRKGEQTLDADTHARLLVEKNDHYLTFIERIDHREILPGVAAFLDRLRKLDCRIALGSSSKNARVILERIGLIDAFEAIVDGTKVTRSKPDPQTFLMGASALNLSPESCVVFEDAVSGVLAAKAAGMYTIGIGSPEILQAADRVIPSLEGLTPEDLLTQTLV